MKNRLQHQFQGFISTPPLWKNKDMFDLEQFQVPSFDFSEDISIEQELPSLKTNYVFGKRMESYFELLLKFSEDWELLAKNVQIRKDKITIGELDFLLKNSESETMITHVELVFKFYIYDPSLKEEASRWIGPNRKDSLVQKITKLKQRQFPLLLHSETLKKLDHLNLAPSGIEQKVCFKAQLFLPKDMINKKFTFINQDCISGYWINMEEFSSEEFQKYDFALPHKQDWAVSPENNSDWINYSEVIVKIKEAHAREKSPLVWLKRETVLFEKMFVVWW